MKILISIAAAVKKLHVVPYKRVSYSNFISKSGQWIPQPTITEEGVLAYLSFFQDTEKNALLKKAVTHISEVGFKRGKSSISWMAFHVGSRSLFINLDSAELRNISLEDEYDPRKMSFKGSLKHELTHLLWDVAKRSPEAKKFEQIVYADAAKLKYLTTYVRKIYEKAVGGHLEVECFADWGKFNEDISARRKFPEQYAAYLAVLSKVHL